MSKDILLFMSDQHSFSQQHYAGDPLVRTPNLDRIAEAGCAMMNCQCSYPMCVPSRMSALTGLLPSHNGVMGNLTSLDSNIPTLMHCLNTAGYDTTLCGRMHFVGPDQRHGFSRRICGNITPVYQNRPTEAFARERGAHLNTPQSGPNSLSAIGAGDSPSLAFDRDVCAAALDFLAGSYEKPQFLCVGTYAPHHPYVAPPELFSYYYDKVTLPEETYDAVKHPALEGRSMQETDPEIVRAVRAAYYGMVEFEDSLIGQVYDAFQDYLTRNGREGVFIYVSDHGDQIASRGFYGKGVLYEPSVHVPMIFAGDGIAPGRRSEGAVSLMDLCPTVCDLAETVKPVRQDGVSLLPFLAGGEDDKERCVVTEADGDVMYSRGVFYYGQAVKKGSWKLIHYDGYEGDDELFDTDADPEELRNVIADHPEIAGELKAALSVCPPASAVREMTASQAEEIRLLMQCSYDSEEERWHCPPCARDLPSPMWKSRLCK